MRFLRHYIYILSCTLIGIMFVSCAQDESTFSFNNDSALSIKLHLGTTTRAATIDGVDDLNENKVSTIDVFLFSADATDADAAVYSNSLSSGSIVFDGVNKTASFDLNVSLGKYTQLFPNSETTCKAYVIVNRPAECTLPDLAACSLSALKHLVINSSQFQVVDEVDGKRVLTPQPLFVMDGFADNITRTDMQLSGDIAVKRAAVKVQLHIQDIADHVEDNGKTFTADKENVRITFLNGCNRAYINETTPASYLKPNKNTDLFNLDNISLNKVNSTDITTLYPIYSYPTYWGNDDAIRTYIILTIDWINDNDATERRTTYYEIPVNAAGDYLMRNTFYKIIQEVNIIGSETIEEATRLYPSNYVILPWGNTKVSGDGTNTDTDAEISKLRYLVLEEPEVQLYNATHKELFYYTSDSIEIRNLVIQKIDVSQIVAKPDTILTIANISSYFNNTTQRYEITAGNLLRPLYLSIHSGDPNIANDHDYIYMSHELINNMDNNSDYSEYIFTFDVVHSDKPEYKESVKIVQYPMIAVVAEPNSVPNDDGGVYVNNSTSSNSSNYGGVHGLTGNNKNPNRYIISVTSLNEGSKYIIGDPRKKEVDNLSTTFSSNRPTMKYPGDTNNRTLKYYHPTVETALTTDMISPRFMIASSYGVTLDISKDNARRRCATYQEDGYPAGRWRLPTQAEIEYIVSLSAMKIIPVLFGTEGSDAVAKYWSANGAVEVKAQSGTVTPSTSTSNGPVRCVYDTWYWTDKCDKTTFTWGDKATF